MIERFPFGQYISKSVECIALTDYPYLAWIAQKGIRNYGLKASVERTRGALNNFTVEAQCQTCKSTARNLSITTTEGRWYVEGAYLFCEKKDCYTATGLDSPQRIVPIRFDAMLAFGKQPDYAMRQFQDLLNRCAGFEGKKTESRCSQFIDDLVRKQRAQESKSSNAEPFGTNSAPSLF